MYQFHRDFKGKEGRVNIHRDYVNVHAVKYIIIKFARDCMTDSL